MARVEILPQFGIVRGSLSKNSEYYIRYNEQTHRHTICKKPQRTPKSIAANQTPSARQTQANFKSAMAYALQVLADPNRKQRYLEEWKKGKISRKFGTLRGYIVHCYYKEYLKNES